jgi:hypothetical protein
MMQYTTWDAPCGCRITMKWDDMDDPHHRKHLAVDDAEHAMVRLERSGRGFHDGISRRGCEAHGHEDHHQHLRQMKDAWPQGDHPHYRTEWHPDGGFTHHYEPPKEK